MSEELNQAPPTKEDIIKFLSEQMEVKKAQYELQDLNTKLAMARAEELKALSFIAQMTNPQNNVPQGTPHIVTQEDLDNNPELVEAGIKVGEEVYKSEEPMTTPPVAASKNLKKK